jgi:pyruvate dehydrogenase (quinone)
MIPGDVALRHATAPALTLGINHAVSALRPSAEELQQAAGLLNRAQKVTILGGAGCEGAHAELIGTAGLLQAPIVHTLRGKEFIEYNNPCDVGMTGLLGFSSGYYAMMDCGLLLMLGTDFRYPEFLPPNAKVIQADNRGEQIGRRTRVDLGLIGNVKDTRESLLPLLEQKPDRTHVDRCVNHYKRARKDLDDLAAGEPGRTPIHPQYVAKVLDELAADDAISSFGGRHSKPPRAFDAAQHHPRAGVWVQPLSGQGCAKWTRR